MTDTHPDALAQAREEVGDLADWWGVDREWTLALLQSATARVGLTRASEYVHLRLTRGGSNRDASLAALHRSIFPDRDVPFAWRMAEHYAAEKRARRARAAARRKAEDREALAERKRRSRARGGDN